MPICYSPQLHVTDLFRGSHISSTKSLSVTRSSHSQAAEFVDVNSVLYGGRPAGWRRVLRSCANTSKHLLGNSVTSNFHRRVENMFTDGMTCSASADSFIFYKPK